VSRHRVDPPAANGEHLRRSHAEWWVVAAVVLLGATCQAVSTSLRFQNADSLVPVYVSVYGWTPFFWDQDRYGMLLPLLALPVRDPLGNLLLQQLLRALALLTVPFALARALGSRATLLVGAGALALWLGQRSLPDFAVASFQPYPVAIVLAGFGLLGLAPGRRAGPRALGAVATLAAVWVAPTVLVWAIPLALARAWGSSEGTPLRAAARGALPFAAVSIASFAAVRVLGWAWPGITRPTRVDLVSPGEWASGVAGLAGRWLETVHPALLAVDGALAVGVVALLLAGRRVPRRVLVAAVVPPALAALEVLVLAALWWVHGNGLAARYLAAGTWFLTLQPALVASELLVDRARFRGLGWRGTALLGGATAVALVAWFGVPSPAATERALDVQMNRSLAAAVRATNEAKCTHLLGDYWRVWPVGFAATARRAREGSDDGVVWPLSGASRMMRERWQPEEWSGARVCVLAGDAKWRDMAGHVGLPLAPDEAGGVTPIHLDATVGPPGSGALGDQFR